MNQTPNSITDEDFEHSKQHESLVKKHLFNLFGREQWNLETRANGIETCKVYYETYLNHIKKLYKLTANKAYQYVPETKNNFSSIKEVNIPHPDDKRLKEDFLEKSFNDIIHYFLEAPDREFKDDIIGDYYNKIIMDHLKESFQKGPYAYMSPISDEILERHFMPFSRIYAIWLFESIKSLTLLKLLIDGDDLLKSLIDGDDDRLKPLLKSLIDSDDDRLKPLLKSLIDSDDDRLKSLLNQLVNQFLNQRIDRDFFKLLLDQFFNQCIDGDDSLKSFIKRSLKSILKSLIDADDFKSFLKQFIDTAIWSKVLEASEAVGAFSELCMQALEIEQIYQKNKNKLQKKIKKQQAKKAANKRWENERSI